MRIAILILAGHAAFAQWQAHQPTGAPRTADGKIDFNGPAPKTADGKPDLAGVWEIAGALSGPGVGNMVPGRAFRDIRLEAPGIRMKPEAAALRAKRAAGNSKDHPDAHCLPVHPVHLHSHPQPRKIVQTPGQLVMMYEANSGLREVFLDGRALPPASGENAVQPTWYGYSVGRWEGEALVVTTRGFRDDGWLDEQGMPTSDAATITERMRRVSYGALETEITVDDPKMFEAPFTFTVKHRLLPDSALIEFICLENQKDQHFVGN